METEPISIDVKSAAKTYPDGTRGLQPTDLHVHPGEVMALLGPSGCGKTTLLRIIAGLESIDRGGQIHFGDQNVTTLPVEKRQVGMVFQHYALFPHLSVAANIGYGPRVRGFDTSRRKRLVAELLELVQLTEHAHKRPAELSGGQRQRVALARAVAAQPKVLLLDEPLTALDAKLKESLRDDLAQLLRRLSITAIYVTHDQQEAMAIADRMAIMRAGRVVQSGDAQTLYRQPGHVFVAQFLGRINQLHRSAEHVRRGVVVLGELELPAPAEAGHAILIRPEHVRLVPADGSGPGNRHGTAFTTRATVASRTFMGNRVQISVEIAGQPPLFVDEHGDCPWQPGQVVSVHIAPDRLLHVTDED